MFFNLANHDSIRKCTHFLSLLDSKRLFINYRWGEGRQLDLVQHKLRLPHWDGGPILLVHSHVLRLGVNGPVRLRVGEPLSEGWVRLGGELFEGWVRLAGEPLDLLRVGVVLGPLVVIVVQGFPGGGSGNSVLGPDYLVSLGIRRNLQATTDQKSNSQEMHSGI